MRTVNVSLGPRSYSILIGENLLKTLGARCAGLKLGQRCAVISDTNVTRRYAKSALASLKSAGFDPILVTVRAGETAKSMENVQACCKKLAEHRLERKSFVVALGGGVVGDLAGFVAAIYLRGIAFVQVPTTLLAQVDSSVGGKVGVNLPAGKNLLGAFHQPRLVLCDLTTLNTLPPREFCAGLAEVIKYGIISDKIFFARLEKILPRLLNRQPAALAETVERCCTIKADVVGQDENETGLRAILNFGHSIGHALEAISGYGTYLHGEAISIGQVAAAQLSVALSGLPAADATRIHQLLQQAGLPVDVRLTAGGVKRLLRAMQLDKKVSDGQLRFVLARQLGQVEWGRNVPLELIQDFLSGKKIQSKGV